MRNLTPHTRRFGNRLRGFSMLVMIWLLAASLAAQIAIELPRVTTLQDSIDIPITTGDTAGEDIYAFYARITYDTLAVTPTAVDTTGTLCAGWGQVFLQLAVPGEIRLSVWDTEPLSGAGTLINLRFQMTGPLGTGTDLVFTQCRYNEGTPSVATTDGILYHGLPDPVIQPTGAIGAQEGDNIVFDVLCDDPLRKHIDLFADYLPTGAGFTDNQDSTATFDWQTGYLDGGSYDVRFRAVNSDGLADTLWTTIAVANTPQPPYVASPIADFGFPEDTVDNRIDLDNVFFDSDFDYGDVLSYTCTGNDSIDVAINDGVVSLQPQPDWNGTETLVFTATDLAAGAASDTVQVTVTPVNDPPVVADPIAGFSFPEDTTDSRIDLNEVFQDVDGDPLVFGYYDNGEIAVDIDAGIVTLEPAADWFGAVDISFTASDQARPTAEHTVQVTVLPLNDPPVVVNPLPDCDIPRNGSTTTVSLDDVFEDVDSPLTYTVTGNNHIAWALNPDNSVTLTPAVDWFGIETLNFIAEDDSAMTASDRVRVSVTDFAITENFNHDSAAPEGWSVTHAGTTTLPWAIVLDAGEDYSYQTGNSVLGTASEKLTSPNWDFSPYQNMQVSFQHDFTHAAGCTAYFQISSDGSTWNTLRSFTQNDSGTVSSSFNAASYVQFRWFFYSSVNLGCSWNIDDFSITGEIADNTPPTTVLDLDVASWDNGSVTLTWSPVTEEFFSHYEVYYTTAEEVTTDDPVWNQTDDPLLSVRTTATTTVTGLAFNNRYRFAIRGVDSFGNAGQLSNVAQAVLADPVTCTLPWPQQDEVPLAGARTLQIGCTFTDDLIVDASTIQYRIDADGNGAYDPGETWQDVTGYSDAEQIQVRVAAIWNADGDDLRFEFRARDTIGSPLVYSGTASTEGYADDWHVRIDTQAPGAIENPVTGALDADSVTLQWTPSDELHFDHYEIYYDTQPGVTTDDALWSVSDDPSLGVQSTSGTTVTGLDTVANLYYFRIRAIDQAGNEGALSEEVTSVPPSDPPLCDNPFPEDQPVPALSNSRTVQIGCTFSDYYGIDHSSVQYRIDANGNGAYDGEETWNDWADGTLREGLREELSIRTDATWDTDGDSLRFEFRAMDIHGFGYTFSGDSMTEGIADDWVVRIDTQPPADITVAAAYAASSTSIDVYWTVSSDLHFQEYEVWYATHDSVTTSDSLWNFGDDPELTQPGSGFVMTTVTGLSGGQSYWFRVRAIDQAGNASPLSPETTATTDANFPPQAPGNITLQTSGNDVVLSWNPVTEDTNGSPITIEAYQVYATSDPDFTVGPEFDITIDDTDGNATDTTFTHGGILNTITSKLFYKVTAMTAAPARSRDDNLQRFRKLLEGLEE